MTKDPVVFTALQIAIIKAVTSINNLKRVSQMNHFRPMNENELSCLARYVGKGVSKVENTNWNNACVGYTRIQGGFTIATVKYEDYDGSLFFACWGLKTQLQG